MCSHLLGLRENWKTVRLHAWQNGNLKSGHRISDITESSTFACFRGFGSWAWAAWSTSQGGRIRLIIGAKSWQGGNNMTCSSTGYAAVTHILYLDGSIEQGQFPQSASIQFRAYGALCPPLQNTIWNIYSITNIARQILQRICII